MKFHELIILQCLTVNYIKYTYFSKFYFSYEKIIEKIRQELIKNADEKTRISGERFFKENVKIYGLNQLRLNGLGKNFIKRSPTRPNQRSSDYVKNYGNRGIWKKQVLPVCGHIM